MDIRPLSSSDRHVSECRHSSVSFTSTIWAIVKKRLGLKQDLYTLLQILSLTLFEKTPILSLLQQSHYNLEMAHDVDQLQLLEI